MAIDRFAVVLRGAQELNGSGLKTLIALLAQCDHNGIYYGTITDLGKVVKMADRTLWRGMAEVRDAGFVEELSVASGKSAGCYRIINRDRRR